MKALSPQFEHLLVVGSAGPVLGKERERAGVYVGATQVQDQGLARCAPTSGNSFLPASHWDGSASGVHRWALCL